jgi:hypothetical protein
MYVVRPAVSIAIEFFMGCDVVYFNSFVVCLTALSVFRLSPMPRLGTNGAVTLLHPYALMMCTRTNLPLVFQVYVSNYKMIGAFA